MKRNNQSKNTNEVTGSHHIKNIGIILKRHVNNYDKEKMEKIEKIVDPEKCIDEIINYINANNLSENDKSYVVQIIIRSWAHEILELALIKIINSGQGSSSNPNSGPVFCRKIQQSNGFNYLHWVGWKNLLIKRTDEDGIQTIKILYEYNNFNCFDKNNEGENLFQSLKAAILRKLLTRRQSSILIEASLNLNNNQLKTISAATLNKITDGTKDKFIGVINYIAHKNPEILAQALFNELTFIKRTTRTKDGLFQLITSKIKLVKDILLTDPSNDQDLVEYFKKNKWCKYWKFAEIMIELCEKFNPLDSSNSQIEYDVIGGILGELYENDKERVTCFMHDQFDKGNNTFAITCMRHSNVLDVELVIKINELNESDQLKSSKQLSFFVFDVIGIMQIISEVKDYDKLDRVAKDKLNELYIIKNYVELDSIVKGKINKQYNDYNEQVDHTIENMTNILIKVENFYDFQQISYDNNDHYKFCKLKEIYYQLYESVPKLNEQNFAKKLLTSCFKVLQNEQQIFSLRYLLECLLSDCTIGKIQHIAELCEPNF
jgi:hypothetical protein